MRDIMKYKCLCCGNYTLPVEPEAAVAFICPVCYWENDVFISSKNEPSDENRSLTLLQARENYKKYGACRIELVQYARKPTEEEVTGSSKMSAD